MADDSKRRGLPDITERRNHARRTVIESRLVSVDLGNSVRGVLIDVGEGGMAVQPFVPLPVGAESDVMFEAPNGARVKAHGLIAWVGENGRTGIRFTDVEPEGLVELRRWAEPAEQNPEGAEMANVSALQQPITIVLGAVGPSAQTEVAPLEDLVERACAVTGAEGAAIAMREGNEVRCAAMVGIAPDLYVVVAAGKGLSGECLRTAQPLVCCDARSDKRVIREAALALNMGSCAMAPIISAGLAVGLLAVFSTRVDAFDEGHLSALVEMAGRISS